MGTKNNVNVATLQEVLREAEADPGKIAALMIDHINGKREKLGISKAKERVLYDMEMRRDLDAV